VPIIASGGSKMTGSARHGTTSLISLPTNCDALLFDDVLLVQTAQRDHFDSMAKMRECGVEVVELPSPATRSTAIADIDRPERG
jgi:arginine deiminase